ncbi:MAG: ABC transporter permease, partial [Anaerolineae bacterium]
MTFIDLFRTVLSNLNRMRMRVVLTAIGVVIGTAAVLVLISLGAGLQRSATQGIGGISDLTLINVMGEQVVMMEKSAPDPSSVQRSEAQGLTLKVLEKLRALPNVVAVTPQEYMQGQVEVHFNRLTGGGGILGVDPEAWKAFGYKLTSGENRVSTGQVVVGAQVGATLYDPRQAGR